MNTLVNNNVNTQENNNIGLKSNQVTTTKQQQQQTIMDVAKTVSIPAATAEEQASGITNCTADKIAVLQDPLLDNEDLRKKRCADRYDSSESSDSGVGASLSCTDSSTASSDSSDPGSPYSPALIICDDLQNSSSSTASTSNATPPSIGPSIQTKSIALTANTSDVKNKPLIEMPPLIKTSSPISSSASKVSDIGNLESPISPWPWPSSKTVGHHVTPTVTLQTSDCANKQKRTNSQDIIDLTSSDPKRPRHCSPFEKSVTQPLAKKIQPKLLIATVPPLVPTSSSLTDDNKLKPLSSPQTKITGYFKTQSKPINGFGKRDLTNLAIRSTEFPKVSTKSKDGTAGKKKDTPIGAIFSAGSGKSAENDIRSFIKVNATTPPPLIKGNTTITRKASITTMRKNSVAAKKLISSTPKKPVNIAPRLPDSPASSVAQVQRNLLSPYKTPTVNNSVTNGIQQQPKIISNILDNHHHHHQSNGIVFDAHQTTNGSKLNGQQTLLLTTIRIPQQSQTTQGQQTGDLIKQPQVTTTQLMPSPATAIGQSPSKLNQMFQFHTPVPMTNLVQIPTLLAAKGGNFIMQAPTAHQNGQQLNRLNAASAAGQHYFLNGAVIKLQPTVTAFNQTDNINLIYTGTSTSTALASTVGPLQQHSMPIQTIVSNGSHLNSSTALVTNKSVPFTSKALPSQLQTIAHQLNGAGQTACINQSTTGQLNAQQQPVFLTTSLGGGLLVNTGLPTVIPSQLTGAVQQPIVTRPSSLTQPPALQPIQHGGNQHNLLANLNAFIQQAQTTAVHTAAKQQVQQTMNVLPNLNGGIPTGHCLTQTLPNNVVGNQHSTITNTAGFSLIETITTSTTSTCVSPRESPNSTEPNEMAGTMKTLTHVESTTISKLSVDIETAIPVITIPKTREIMDLCSPAVPQLSPIRVDNVETTATDKVMMLPNLLASPKSLIMERIQQKNPMLANTLMERKQRLNSSETILSVNKVEIETQIQTANLPECAKSPMLSEPKNIRFPATDCLPDTGKNRKSNVVRGNIRRTDGRIVGACYWDNCSEQYDTNSQLLDHLQTRHVNQQKGPFSCRWKDCKVHSKESCSRQWLERHVLSHGSAKPYKCIVDGCGLRFSTASAVEKHVNSHFNTTDGKESSSKKSLEPPVQKLIRKTGKKLRYRRQPLSSRRVDYFDVGIMEGLQHRLSVTGSLANGPDGTVRFEGKTLARRTNSGGETEVLVQWSPAGIIENEWILETESCLVKYRCIKSFSWREKSLLKTHLTYSKNGSQSIADSLFANVGSKFPIKLSLAHSSISPSSDNTVKRSRKRQKSVAPLTPLS